MPQRQKKKNERNSDDLIKILVQIQLIPDVSKANNDFILALKVSKVGTFGGVRN